MLSDNNKFLKIRKGVILTPTIDAGIYTLDFWFEKENLSCEVTSGLRTTEKQLQLIKEKAIKHNIHVEFPLITGAQLNIPNTWIPAWSRLLTIGEMINPPIATKCLFDYKKSDGTLRKAGTLIPVSGHQLGEDFDIGGFNKELNQAVSLDAIVKVLKVALLSAEVKGIIAGYLKEPVNGAVHVDCVKAKDV